MHEHKQSAFRVSLHDESLDQNVLRVAQLHSPYAGTPVLLISVQMLLEGNLLFPQKPYGRRNRKFGFRQSGPLPDLLLRRSCGDRGSLLEKGDHLVAQLLQRQGCFNQVPGRPECSRFLNL